MGNFSSLLRIPLTALIVYMLYCALLFVAQRKIIFPISGIGHPPAKQISGIEILWLETENGKVEAWFIPPEQNRRHALSPAVIFAHGNAEIIDDFPSFLKNFARLGIGVLIVEYPGYGRSAGKPSQKSIANVFIAAYDTLVSRISIDSSRIIFFGRSVGGGAICALASQRPAAAMILMSTFKSVRSFAIRYGAPSFLVRDPFDNLAVIKAFENPILLIHGKYDTIIPSSHSIALHKAASHANLIMYDCGHNDCPPDEVAFWADIESFLRENEII